jgi:hypothetical protein
MANVLRSSCLIPVSLATQALAVSDSRVSVPASRVTMQLQALVSGLQRLHPQISWEIVGVAVTLCSIVPGFWWLRRTWKSSSLNSVELEGSQGGIMRHTVETTGKIWTSELAVTLLTMADAEATDPGLLKKHSELKSFKTSRFVYSNIRVFYRRHPQADKLPTPPLPLLVFIHGQPPD